jgi:hypothetical protein
LCSFTNAGEWIVARLSRFVIPGQPQHVILRGNNRTEIFCAEADYQFYLENSSKPAPHAAATSTPTC